jgi:ACS family sodium-dependent inorganic phosphate cotransporter
MLLCNLDRVAMGILAVPLLTEFNINLAEMGVLQSSYLWGYLVGQLPAGVAADKFGGTRVMLCGLVLWSLATCGTFLAKLSTFPLTVAITSRVLMGLGSAVALPAVAATVARNVPADQKARSTTMCYALFNVGNVLGNLCTPYVSEYVGWHWSFMIYGALGLVWACISIRIMGAPGKKGEEPLFVQEEKAEKKKLPKIDLRKVVFRKKFLAQLFILMYCHSTIGLGYFTLQSWIPTFMSNDLGITNLKVAGLCTGLVWLATSFNTAFVGVIADKLLSKMPAWKVRKAAMTVSTVVPSICFFILSTTRNPLVGVCCILVGLVCWSFDYAGFHPYVVEVSGNYSGTVLSMTNSAGVIAGIVGNITTGYLVGLEGNFNCVFRILSGVYLVSCILWNLFMKGEKLDFRAA